MTKLGSAYGEIVINADSVTNAINIMHGFDKSMKTVGTAVAASVAAMGAGIIKVGADSLSAAKDMDQAMADIASVMNKTKEQIAPLGELIKDLGLDPNLKVTAVEAASAIEMLGRNGLSMTEILDGAAKSTVLLANATGAEFATAANISTDAMAIFGIEAANMEQAVNGIVSVTTNSKFGIEDYAFALAQAGGVASSVGVEFDDFNTAITAISPLFKAGADAGTSFKGMLQRLAPTSGRAIEKMQELGLITEEGSNQFFDANGNLKDMATIAGILQGSLSGLSEEQRNTALSIMFGTDAMRAAVGLMEVGEEGFRDLMGTMSETDALRNAATRMDTLAGASEILDGIIETVSLTFGQALLPAARAVIDALIDLADAALPKIEAAMGSLSGVITNVVTAVQEFFTQLRSGEGVMGSLESALSVLFPEATVTRIMSTVTAVSDFINNVGQVISPVMQAVSGFISLQDILMALGIALLYAAGVFLGPILAGIAGVIAPLIALIGVIALVRNAFMNDFAGIRDFVGGVWSAIQQVFGAFKALFQGDMNGFLDGIRSAWENGWSSLTTFLGNIWSMVQPHLATLWAAIVAWFQGVDWVGLMKNVGSLIATGFGNLWQWVLPRLQGFWQSVIGFFGSLDFGSIAQSLGAGINNALSTVVAFINDKFGIDLSGIITKVIGVLGGLGTAFGVVVGLLPNIGSLVGGASGAFSGLSGWVTSLVGHFGGLSPILSQVGAWFGLLVQSVPGLSTVLGTLGGWITSVGGTLSGLLGPAITTVVGVFGRFFGTIVSGASSFISLISNTRIVSGLMPILSGGFTTVVNAGRFLFGIFSNLGTVFGFLGPLVGQLGTWFAGLIGHFGFLGPLVSGIGSVFGSLSPILGAVLAAINPVTLAIGAIIAVIAALSAASTGQLGNIQAVFQTVWTAIQAVISSTLAVIRPAITQFIEGVKAGFANVQPLIQAFSNLWVSLQPLISQVATVIGAVLVTLWGVIVGVFNGIAAAIQPFIETIISVATSIVEAFTGVIDFIVGFFDLIVGLFTGNGEMIKEALTQMGEAIVQVFTSLFEGIIALATGAWETLVAGVSGFVEGIITFFTDLYQKLVGGSIVPDMVNGIISFFQLLMDTGAAIWQALVDVVVSLVQSLMDTAISIVQALWDTAVAIFQAGADFISAIVEAGFAIIQAIIETAITIVTAVIQTGWDLITTVFQTAVDIVSTVVETGFIIIQTIIETAMTIVESVITAVMAAIQGNWTAAWAAIQSIVTAAWNMIKSIFTTAVTAILSIVVNLVNGIKEKFNLDWGSVGSAVIDGIKAGISAGVGALKDAVKNAAQAALDAAKALLGISSPSKAFEDIGLWSGEGMAVGIKKASQGVADAVSTTANNVLSVGVKEFGEAVKGIVDSIDPIIEAIKRLDAFKPAENLAGKIGGLAYQLRQVIQPFKTLATEFASGLDDVVSFSESVQKILALVQPAIDAVVAIGELDKPAKVAYGKIKFLADTIGNIIWRLGEVGYALNEGWTDHANRIADSASGILDLVQPAIDVVSALGEFSKPAKVAYGKIKFLADTIGNIIWRLGEVGYALNEGWTDHANRIADSAGKIIDLIEPAIEGLTTLSAFDDVSDLDSKMAVFADFIDQIVTSMADIAINFSEEALDAASAFAEAAADVLDIYEPTLDSISALGEFNGVAQDAESKISDLNTIISFMVDGIQAIAQQFATEALDAASAFAEAAADVLDLIGPAVEAITSLGSFTGPAQDTEEKISELNAVIALLVEEIGAIAQRFSSEAMAAAKLFADSAGAVLKLVEPAIDAVVAIAEYTEAADLDSHLQQFTSDLVLVSTQLVDALTTAASAVGEDALSQAKELAKDIANVTKSVFDAMGSVEDISGAEMPDITPQVNYLLDQIPILANALTSVSVTLNGTVVDAASDFKDNLQEVVSAVLDALDTLDALINANTSGTLQSIIEDMLAAMENASVEAGDIGADFGNNFGSEIVDAASVTLSEWVDFMADLLTELDDMSSESQSEWERMLDTIESLTISGWTSVISAFQSAGTTVVSTVNQMVDGIVDAFDAVSWGSVGTNITDTIAAAIKAGKSKVIDAAVEVARAALEAMEEELGISSPSKEAERRIAGPVIAGVVKGLRDFAAVQRAARNLAGSIVSQPVTQNINNGGSRSVSNRHVFGGMHVHVKTLTDSDEVYKLR